MLKAFRAAFVVQGVSDEHARMTVWWNHSATQCISMEGAVVVDNVR